MGEWTTFRLGSVCSKIGSGATPRGGNSVYLDQGEVALIRSQNVYNDGFHHGGLTYLTEHHAAELENVEVVEGDVLLNITGDSVARSCQVDSTILPARVNQHVAIIRPDPALLWPRFLRYYLVSPTTQAEMLSLAGAGATRNALTKGMIESFEVPAPVDVAEQRAIARILGTLDDKIELNRRTNETLEQIARALFKSWFVDFDPVRAKSEGREPGLPSEIANLFPDSFEESELGEIPRGWEVETLGELSVKPQYGFTASARAEAVGPKFLRITDVNKRPWIEWSSVPFCEISEEEHSRYRVASGDIVIARMADPGHGVMIEEDVDAVFASYLIRFRPKDAIFARFLQYWLRSDYYWDLVGARYTGTTRASLNAKVLSAFQLVRPSERVVQAFSDTTDALRSKVISNVLESENLAALRDALLPMLISGELRIGKKRDATRGTTEAIDNA